MSYFFSIFLYSNFFVDGCTDKYNYNKVKRWSTDIPSKDMFAIENFVFMHNIDESHWNCEVIFMEDKRIH